LDADIYLPVVAIEASLRNSKTKYTYVIAGAVGLEIIYSYHTKRPTPQPSRAENWTNAIVAFHSQIDDESPVFEFDSNPSFREIQHSYTLFY